MDDSTLRARQHRSQRASYRAFDAGSPGARVLDLDGGVQATVTPAIPSRSLPNAVVYEHSQGAALRAQVARLDAIYVAAGVLAWTVWVRPGDDETASALAEAGHVLDGTPELMAAPLGDLDLAPRLELDLVAEPAWADVAACNDEAYGLPSGSFSRWFATVGERGFRRFVARLDGAPAATVTTLIVDGDCWFGFVATAPPAQGRGLCSELMRHALRDAAAEGATTASLEATRAGRPVYARLGMRELGTIAMWERRRSAPVA
jgi:GNAT superfamily N-acetyltransferase